MNGQACLSVRFDIWVLSEVKDTAPDVIVNDTHYTYDPLGQLIKEVRNNVTVNEMTYDNLGNIKKKNGVTYTYSTGAWKDQLIGFGSKSITYDAQGNPLIPLYNNNDEVCGIRVDFDN